MSVPSPDPSNEHDRAVQESMRLAREASERHTLAEEAYRAREEFRKACELVTAISAASQLRASQPWPSIDSQSLASFNEAAAVALLQMFARANDWRIQSEAYEAAMAKERARLEELVRSRSSST